MPGSGSGSAIPARRVLAEVGTRIRHYLFDELFGRTTSKGKYVYLSDGGHFENLGVYELIRRRCRHIVLCDAGADPENVVLGPRESGAQVP